MTSTCRACSFPVPGIAKLCPRCGHRMMVNSALADLREAGGQFGRGTRIILLVVVGLLVIGLVSRATSGNSAEHQERVARSTLARLAQAQRFHRRMRHTYAESLDSLRFRRDDSVRVELSSADSTSWSAAAWYNSAVRCTIAVSADTDQVAPVDGTDAECATVTEKVER